MKYLKRSLLVFSIIFSAMACGGVDPGAVATPDPTATAELPAQPGEIHLTAIDQSLVQAGDGDAAREQCGPPKIDDFGMCSRWCCIKVFIWGMEACWLAPAPGECTVQQP